MSVPTLPTSVVPLDDKAVDIWQGWNAVVAKSWMTQNISTTTQLASTGKVNLALSVIGHPEAVSIAMTSVLGDTLICADADTAKLVAFSAQVGGVRSVMLDGDMYDPSAGTL